MGDLGLVLAAPAKVNLHLSVGALRADGYHEVVTVMQSLALADLVRIGPADSLSVACEPDPGGPGSSNTAWRAAEALAEATGRDPEVAISIEKRIPAAAGLGGGSADAAAVIYGLCSMWGLDPRGQVAMDAAAKVGADVPFFLVGGAALFDRRGDRFVRYVEPLIADIVLVNPGVPVPTTDVYTAYDRQGADMSRTPDAVIEALDEGDMSAVVSGLHNDLTAAAAIVAPVTAECLGWLASREGVLGALLAGSGATCFGICSSADAASAVAEDARRRGWTAFATSATSDGVTEVGP